MSFLRRRWKFLVGVAISVVFLWFSLRGLHLQAVWYYIQIANFWWILPAVAVYFAAVWARTWRWHYLLRPLKPVPLVRLFPIVCIGYFGNNVYPARAGEVIRGSCCAAMRASASAHRLRRSSSSACSTDW